MTGAAADEAVTLMRKLLRSNGLGAPSERWESDMAFLASQSRPDVGPGVEWASTEGKTPLQPVTTSRQNGFLADPCFRKSHELAANGVEVRYREVLRLPVS